MNIPFTPAQSVALAVTTASARVALPNPGTGSRTIMLTEGLGLEISYVAFGDVTVTAVPPIDGTPQNGYPILPGSKEPVTISPTATHVAAITIAGTAQLLITSGDGV